MDFTPITTTTPPSTAPAEPIGSVIVTTLLALWSFLLSSPTLREGAKLFLIGGALESARRIVGMAWTSFVEYFFVTVEFEDRDETFTWMMFWLSKQPRWNQSRSIRVTTFRYGQSGVSDQLPGEAEENKNALSRRLAYVPSHNKAVNMWHKKTWMSVTLTQTQGDMWNRRGDERLTITLFSRRISKIDDLLLEAKRSYKRDSEGRINIYVSDANNDWALAGSRPRRPMSSVVLDKSVKERLLADAKDFMASEKWYADRGIPWRRGYLLHGCPGSGKTSLIHSLAGELGLDIYVISLSKKTLDDSTLNELISKLPARSLALMEDIDAAFFRGLTRESEAAGVPLMPGQPPGEPTTPSGPAPVSSQAPMHSASAVTLSGLLGAIDGVAAQEGRILFATTNKYAALDPALVRPGRLDVHIRFNNAGKQQAAELFRCFFPPVLNDGEESEEDEGITDETSLDETVSTTAVGSPAGSPLQASFPPEGSSSIVKPSSDLVGVVMCAVDPGGPCPSLPRSEVKHLALEFAKRVPDGEFSMAAIQGLLMRYKTDPYRVIREVEAWVADERQKRAEREGRTLESATDERKVADSVVSEKGGQTPTPEEMIDGEVLEGKPGEETVPSLEACVWWPLGML